MYWDCVVHSFNRVETLIAAAAIYSDDASVAKLLIKWSGLFHNDGFIQSCMQAIFVPEKCFS